MCGSRWKASHPPLIRSKLIICLTKTLCIGFINKTETMYMFRSKKLNLAHFRLPVLAYPTTSAAGRCHSSGGYL
jgi:hypothetical protein